MSSRIAQTLEAFDTIGDDVCNTLHDFDNLVAEMNGPQTKTVYKKKGEDETSVRMLYENLVKSVTTSSKANERKLEEHSKKLHNKENELKTLQCEFDELKKKQNVAEGNLKRARSKVDHWNKKIAKLQSLKNEVKVYKMISGVHFVYSSPNIKGYIEQKDGTLEPFDFKASQSPEEITQELCRLIEKNLKAKEGPSGEPQNN